MLNGWKATRATSGRGSRATVRRSRSRLLDELQRGGVHAVALMRRRWAVRKHMSEVAVAARATRLGPHHPVRAVDDLADMLGVDRLEEAWPARAGLEFRAG